MSNIKKGDILHRDNPWLAFFNTVNLLSDNKNLISENAAQDLHKAQRKLSIEREKIMDQHFRLSVGKVTILAFIGLIAQNLFSLTQKEFQKMNYLTLYSIKSDSIAVIILQTINVIINIGIISLTCYLNIYSQGMVDQRDGIKQHKKLGKLVYRFGLFSSLIYLIQGFCSSNNFYLFGVALVQAYFLLMCVGTASMKQFISHRVWSYCLNTLFLQIAFNVYFDWLLSVFGKEEYLPYSSGVSTLLAAFYLIRQEYSIDLFAPLSNAIFQISLDTLTQNIQVVSENVQENPFKKQFCDKNAIRLDVSSIQLISKLLVYGLTVLWFALSMFAEERVFNSYKAFLTISLVLYILSVVVPMTKKLKEMKRIKKLIKQQNKKK